MKDQASAAAADWSQDSAVEQSPLFQDIDRYLINLWLSSCTEHSFEAGQVVIEAGTRTNEIFLLLSGELRVHVEADGAESLRTLEPGEIAGEVSILTGSTTSAWVTATQPSRALGISREELTQWVQQSHQFSLNLLQIANHRLHSSNLHARHQHREKRKLQAIAMTDGLTGLLNRHWLSLNAQRFQGVSVLALDLDHFKSINDRFGHGAGDQVLQAVAEQLRQGTRPHDAVMRLGGEEFVIVVDMSRSDGDPLQLAERLRVAIEELHIPLCGDEGADQLRITISIGVATQARQESWEQLLERADQALYSAKNKGRNQVQLA